MNRKTHAIALSTEGGGPPPPEGQPPPTRTRRPFATTGQWHALGLIALIGGALLLSGRFIPRRSGVVSATRVIDALPRPISAAPMLSLFQDRAYAVTLPASADGRPDSVGSVMVSTASANGQRAHPATRRTLDRSSGIQLPSLYLAGNEMRYFTYARTAELIRRLASGGGPMEREQPPGLPFPSRFHGTFLLAPGGGSAPGENRTHYRGWPVPSGSSGRPLTLHRAPLDSATEQVIPLDTLGYPVLALYRRWTDRAIYWVRPSPTGWDAVQGNGGYRYEHPATAELIETPLDGGSARRVATGLLNPTTGATVTATEEGVFWKTPRPFPDTRQDLHYLTQDDLRRNRAGGLPRPHVVLDFVSEAPPIFFRGRLYWIEPVRSEAALQPTDLGWYSAFRTREASLISTTRDGADRRRLIAGGTEPGLILRSLHRDTARDRLYLFGTTPALPGSRGGADASRQTPFVAAVHPESAASIGKRLTLPEDTWFEPRRVYDGYLYFVRVEERRDLVAAVADLFAEHAAQSAPPALWRIRLPE